MPCEKRSRIAMGCCSSVISPLCALASRAAPNWSSKDLQTGHWKSRKTDTVVSPSPMEMEPASASKLSLAVGVAPGEVAWLLRNTTSPPRATRTTTTAMETPIANQLVLLFAAAITFRSLEARPRTGRVRLFHHRAR